MSKSNNNDRPFQIVEGSPKEVDVRCNLLIEWGWKCHGDIHIFQYGDNTIAFQCMANAQATKPNK